MKKRCTVPKNALGYPVNRLPGKEGGQVSRIDPRVKAQVWEMYVAGESTVAEICAKFNLSYYTVQHDWISSGGEGWAAKRRTLEKELMDMVGVQASNAIRRNFNRVILRHINLAEMMDSKIEAHLKGILSAKELEAVSKAFKNSADIAARAVGLDKNTVAQQVQSTVHQTINYGAQFKPIPVAEHAKEFSDAQIEEPARLAAADRLLEASVSPVMTSEPVNPVPVRVPRRPTRHARPRAAGEPNGLLSLLVGSK